MLYPLLFRPIFKERIWGGRRLEQLYHKPLPPNVPIGESWEISDRPGDSGVIANGPLAGKDLHWLVQHQRSELLGTALPYRDRFPLLVKILDARDKLSLQVHPPPETAPSLGGEPKTEMWYITEADPGAELYVGLKAGVTRQEFERKLHAGTVAECFHRVSIRAGDAMFLPSGRVHAIGAGMVIFEIQQNSDTTYRVFDWNRLGLDGKPRDLHIPQSLASIRFDDLEPGLVPGDSLSVSPGSHRVLASHPLFEVQSVRIAAGAKMPLTPGKMRILGLVQGRLQVTGGKLTAPLEPGGFCLVPAELPSIELQAGEDPALLLITEAGAV